MSKIIQVVCPEHERAEIVEVASGGEITWCSRVAGRPVCDGLCLSHGMRHQAPSLDVDSKAEPAEAGPAA